MKNDNHIVLVPIFIKKEYIQEFIMIIKKNAEESLKEPGVVRFDVLQSKEDSTCFQLIEEYLSPRDQQLHRQTPHFLEFSKQMTDMVQEPYIPGTYHMI